MYPNQNLHFQILKNARQFQDVLSERGEISSINIFDEFLIVTIYHH